MEFCNKDKWYGSFMICVSACTLSKWLCYNISFNCIYIWSEVLLYFMKMNYLQQEIMQIIVLCSVTSKSYNAWCYYIP